jgi:hypothetical protein
MAIQYERTSVSVRIESLRIVGECRVVSGLIADALRIYLGRITRGTDRLCEQHEPDETLWRALGAIR